MGMNNGQMCSSKLGRLFYYYFRTQHFCQRKTKAFHDSERLNNLLEVFIGQHLTKIII